MLRPGTRLRQMAIRGRAMAGGSANWSPTPPAPSAYLVRRGYETLLAGSPTVRPVGAGYDGATYPGERTMLAGATSMELFTRPSSGDPGYWVTDFYLCVHTPGALNITAGCLLANSDADTGDPNTFNVTLESGGARTFQIRLNNSVDAANNFPVWSHETVFVRHITYARGGVYGEMRIRRAGTADGSWDFTCAYQSFISIGGYAQRWCLVNARKGDGGVTLAPVSAYSVTGLSVYQTPDLATGQAMPSDLLAPLAQATWLVSASAAGGGNGRTTAWTPAELVTELLAGTVRGKPAADAWADAVGTSSPLSGLTTRALHKTWDDEYEAGDRLLTGDTIRASGECLFAAQLRLEQWPGVSVQIPTGSAISCRRTVAGPFTRPDAGSHPLVWKATGTDYVAATETTTGGVIEEDGLLLGHVAAANEAAALTALTGAVAGTCWADTTGIYFTTLTGTDPNTDGRTRTAARRLTQSGTGSGVVQMATNRLYGGGSVRGGLVVNYADAGTTPQYTVSQTTGGLSVVDGVTVDGGSYHLIGQVGGGITGHLLRTGVTYSRMATPGGAITDVDYTSEMATLGLIYSGFRDCTAVDEWLAQRVAATNTFDGQSYYSHSNMGRTNKAFALDMQDCVFGGTLNPSLNRADEWQVQDSTVRAVWCDGAIAVDRCTLTTGNVQTYTGGTVAISDSVLVASGAGVQQVGVVTYVGCTFDLTGVSGALITAGSATPVVTGCAVITAGNTLSAVATTETFTETGLTTADLGLDADYRPLAGSSVIGAGYERLDAPDRTGVIFAVRDDAGAYEYVA